MRASVKSTIKQRRGAAMVLALIVMAVITVLCLSLLLSVSTLMSGAGKALSEEQCRVWAVSLSRELENQLTDPYYTFLSQDEEDAARDGTLWFYLRDNVWSNAWPYYNEDERGHTARFAHRYFTIDTPALPESIQQDIDNMEILMYWEADRESTVESGAALTIRVTCTHAGQTCTITSEYTMGYNLLSYDVEVPPAEGETEPGTETVEYAQWLWSLDWRE